MTGCQPSSIGCPDGKPRNFCYCNIVDTTCTTDPYEACGLAPSYIPTKSPTPVPTKKPSPVPTKPTFKPTSSPSSTSPTFLPSTSPTFLPSTSPTFLPTAEPTVSDLKLINGDFEQNNVYGYSYINPTGWQSSSLNVVLISYSSDNAWGRDNNPNGGNVFIGLQLQGNYIQQNLTGVPNSYFYLEFDQSYRYIGFAAPTTMQVLCNDIVVLSYSPTASWQKMKTNVCTTNSLGICTIKFLNAKSAGDCTGFIDNVIVSVISADKIMLKSCQMWLDGADHSQVKLSSGSLVSTWYDKSGNGNHATQSNIANQPTYSNNGGMIMNGSHWFTTPITAVASTESLFIVFETSNSIIGELFAGTTTYTRELLILDGNIYVNNWGTPNFRNSFYTTFGGTCPLNSKTIIDYQYHQSSITINKNGFLTGSGIPLSFGAGSGTSNIGSSNYMPNNLNGVIYEVIYYNTFLGLTETKIVEGYLAWKWKLQSSLPSSHPYKSFPPFTTTPSLSPTSPSLSPTSPSLSPTSPSLSPTLPSLSPATPSLSPQPISPQPSLSIHHPNHPRSSSKKPSQNTKKKYQWWQGAKRYVGYKYQKND